VLQLEGMKPMGPGQVEEISCERKRGPQKKEKGFHRRTGDEGGIPDREIGYVGRTKKVSKRKKKEEKKLGRRRGRANTLTSKSLVKEKGTSREADS